MDNEWMTRQRFCPNCGKLGLCYGVGENQFRFKCSTCQLESVLIIKNRRNTSVEEYFPRYMNMMMRQDANDFI